jgi:hypothetical protein
MLPPFRCFALENLINVAYILDIYYHAKFQDSVSSNTVVAFTSPVRASAMLLLYEIRVGYPGITIIPNFVKLCQLIENLNWDHVDNMAIS